jgi:hypothetical protein
MEVFGASRGIYRTDWFKTVVCASYMVLLFTKLGIGIEVDAAGIGIPASRISIRYRSIPVPDWVPFSGTGLVPASEVLFIPVPN